MNFTYLRFFILWSWSGWGTLFQSYKPVGKAFADLNTLNVGFCSIHDLKVLIAQSRRKPLCTMSGRWYSNGNSRCKGNGSGYGGSGYGGNSSNNISQNNGGGYGGNGGNSYSRGRQQNSSNSNDSGPYSRGAAGIMDSLGKAGIRSFEQAEEASAVHALRNIYTGGSIPGTAATTPFGIGNGLLAGVPPPAATLQQQLAQQPLATLPHHAGYNIPTTLSPSELQATGASCARCGSLEHGANDCKAICASAVAGVNVNLSPFLAAASTSTDQEKEALVAKHYLQRMAAAATELAPGAVAPTSAIPGGTSQVEFGKMMVNSVSYKRAQQHQQQQ